MIAAVMRATSSLQLAAVLLAGGCGFDIPDEGGNGGAPSGPDAGASARKDTDGDGFMDDVDVCPNVVDPQQRDHDGDKRGDACDVCPHRADNGADQDLDGVGDACDPRPTLPGDRIAYFEGFYQPVSWSPVIGGNSWAFENGTATQAKTDTAYQLIRDDNPDLGHVLVEARFRVAQITGDTSTRRSAGIVAGYHDKDTYWFCGLAASGAAAEVDAGKVSWGLFGDSFDFNLGAFADAMPGDWAVLRARTTSGSNGDGAIECAVERNGVTGSATFQTGAAVGGDVGIRTNGAAASFDYVFVVASP